MSTPENENKGHRSTANDRKLWMVVCTMSDLLELRPFIKSTENLIIFAVNGRDKLSPLQLARIHVPVTICLVIHPHQLLWLRSCLTAKWCSLYLLVMQPFYSAQWLYKSFWQSVANQNSCLLVIDEVMLE